MKYILVLLIIISIFFLFEDEKTKAKNFSSKRLECQKQSTSFEKISKSNQVKKAIKLLESSNYEIQSIDIDYSKYMKSKLKESLTKQEAKKQLDLIIKDYIKTYKKQSEKMQIKYYIYENDKEDKRKKSDSCKLYEGYILLEFLLNKQSLYKIQSDYMKEDLSDMKDRISCALKSFISLKDN